MGDILVVGSTGKVGRNLLETLVNSGAPVRAATREPAKAKVPAGAMAVKFDLADPTTFGPALEGVDRLFVMSPPGLPIGALVAFVQFAAPKVKRVVTMTANGAQYDEQGPLRQLERAVEAGAKEWTHLRPGWFMQNFEAFHLPSIRATGKVRLPVGDAKSAFIDARDIADSAAAALTQDGFMGQAISLTGGEAISYAQAAAILSEQTGAKIGFENLDDATYASSMIGFGFPPPYVNFMVGLYATVRAGHASHVVDGVQKLTGKAPRTFAGYARDHRAIFA